MLKHLVVLNSCPSVIKKFLEAILLILLLLLLKPVKKSIALHGLSMVISFFSLLKGWWLCL